jgi:ATP adenylyltransferase
MEPSKNCRFCDIVAGKYKYAGIDEPFASNDEFIALASIGAIVEGWSLIIPKAHQLSMRNVYWNSVLSDFLGSVLPPLIYQYGPLIAFEHGANKEGSTTACGTDHAHLHLVPIDESLLPDLNGSGLKWVQCHTTEIAFRSGHNEYLFYTELSNNAVWQDPVGYLHILDQPISQFFRRLLAKRKGGTEEFDYNRFPYLDNARQTRMLLLDKVA